MQKSLQGLDNATVEGFEAFEQIVLCAGESQRRRFYSKDAA